MYWGFTWVNITCFLFFDAITSKTTPKKTRTWSILMCVIFGYHVTVCIAPTYFHRNLGSLALTRPLYVTLHSVYFRSCCLKQFKMTSCICNFCCPLMKYRLLVYEWRSLIGSECVGDCVLTLCYKIKTIYTSHVKRVTTGNSQAPSWD